MDYVIKNGISRVIDYPDVMRDQGCLRRSPFGGVGSYRYIKNRQEITSNLNLRPVALGIEVENNMRFYRSGIYYGSYFCGSKINSFVLGSGYEYRGSD